ncbi:hypothetical protein [Streptomyces sp. NPDC053427]|uniref:hypothetical protein n=1 Tax=Streptomyces sp. NPDC053427 TaxID=3365701 RepID=UPI0037CD4561
MDVDLCGYLDALCVTKGAYGWQYLFTDVSLAEDDHEVTAEFLTEMLAVLPDVFPAHDYEPQNAPAPWRNEPRSMDPDQNGDHWSELVNPEDYLHKYFATLPLTV